MPHEEPSFFRKTPSGKLRNGTNWKLFFRSRKYLPLAQSLWNFFCWTGEPSARTWLRNFLSAETIPILNTPVPVRLRSVRENAGGGIGHQRGVLCQPPDISGHNPFAGTREDEPGAGDFFKSRSPFHFSPLQAKQFQDLSSRLRHLSRLYRHSLPATGYPVWRSSRGRVPSLRRRQK